MNKKKNDVELFEFFQDQSELWFWNKKINNKIKSTSSYGYESKQDCINDAIINGYTG